MDLLTWIKRNRVLTISLLIFLVVLAIIGLVVVSIIILTVVIVVILLIKKKRANSLIEIDKKLEKITEEFEEGEEFTIVTESEEMERLEKMGTLDKAYNIKWKYIGKMADILDLTYAKEDISIYRGRIYHPKITTDFVYPMYEIIDNIKVEDHGYEPHIIFKARRSNNFIIYEDDIGMLMKDLSERIDDHVWKEQNYKKSILAKRDKYSSSLMKLVKDYKNEIKHI